MADEGLPNFVIKVKLECEEWLLIVIPMESQKILDLF